MRTSKGVMVALAVGTGLLAAPLPAHAGPPWISVEYPTNPHHPSTRDAAFLVRLYHHSESIDVPVSGRAEGMIDGRHKVVDVKVAKTTLPGVFAVSGLPKVGGAWVVVITMNESGNPASAIVTVGADGAPLAVTVPSTRTHDGWTVPREATPKDVMAQLTQATALAQAMAQTAAPASKPSGAALPLLLLPIGAVVAAGVLRRREQD
jgi:hypothetical protein